MAFKGRNTPAVLEELDKSLAKNLPNLFHVLQSRGDTVFWSLYVKQKGADEWVSVLKATRGDSPEMMVSFGTGYDWNGCLMALNRSLAADKWYPDKLPVSKSSSQASQQLPLL